MMQPSRSSHPAVRHYAGAIFATVVCCLVALVWFGWQTALIMVVLSALEITFSFDNALINAKILSRMSQGWRTVFMTFGVAVAVVGVRLIVPLLLVSLTSGTDMLALLHLALEQPGHYAQKVAAIQPVIAAFGGMFLLLTFLRFMLDASRKVHWLRVIERPLAKAGQLNQLPLAIALCWWVRDCA